MACIDETFELPRGLTTTLVAEAKASGAVLGLYPGPVRTLGNEFAEKLLREMALNIDVPETLLSLAGVPAPAANRLVLDQAGHFINPEDRRPGKGPRLKRLGLNSTFMVCGHAAPEPRRGGRTDAG